MQSRHEAILAKIELLRSSLSDYEPSTKVSSLLQEIIDDISVSAAELSAAQLSEYLDELSMPEAGDWYGGNTWMRIAKLHSTAVSEMLELFQKIVNITRLDEKQILEHLNYRDSDGNTMVMIALHRQTAAVVNQYINLLFELIENGVDAIRILSHLDKQNTHGSKLIVRAVLGLTTSQLNQVLDCYLELLSKLQEKGVDAELILEHLSTKTKSRQRVGTYYCYQKEEKIELYLSFFATLLNQADSKDKNFMATMQERLNSKSDFTIHMELVLAAKSDNIAIVSAFMPYIAHCNKALDRLDKETLFAKIKLLNPADATHYLKQCRDKTTPLGKRFRKNEGMMPVPSSSYWGMLKRIDAAIKELDPARALNASSIPSVSVQGEFGERARRLTLLERTAMAIDDGHRFEL